MAYDYSRNSSTSGQAYAGLPALNSEKKPPVEERKVPSCGGTGGGWTRGRKGTFLGRGVRTGQIRSGRGAGLVE